MSDVFPVNSTRFYIIRCLPAHPTEQYLLTCQVHFTQSFVLPVHSSSHILPVYSTVSGDFTSTFHNIRYLCQYILLYLVILRVHSTVSGDHDNTVYRIWQFCQYFIHYQLFCQHFRQYLVILPVHSTVSGDFASTFYSIWRFYQYIYSIW